MSASLSILRFVDLFITISLLLPTSVSGSKLHGDVSSSQHPSVTATEAEATTTLSTLHSPSTTEHQIPVYDIIKESADAGRISCKLRRLPRNKYNFDFIFTQERITDWMCRCKNICGTVTVNPIVLGEIHENTYRDKEKIASVISVFTVVLIIGMTGNILTIVGLLRWVKKSSPTFAFIISLSISDLLLLSVCMPLKVSEYFYFSDVFTEWTCKLSYYLRDFSLVCSVLTLTVISFERYYAICHPLVVQYRCTLVRARIIIMATWVVSLCLAIPSIFMTKFYTPLGKIFNVCIPQSSNVHYLILYFTYFMGILFVLPMIVMVTAYGRSSYTLWKSTRVSRELQGARTQSNHTKSSHAENDDQSRRQVIALLILIAIVFMVCWGPPLIVQLLVVMDYITVDREQIRLGVESLTYVSSTLNPYLFMAMSSQFRVAALRCIRYRRRSTNYREASSLMPTVTYSATETYLDKI